MSYKGMEAGMLIVGKTIESVRMNPFDDKRGGETYAPTIIFEDGSRLCFLVDETEDEYGVDLLYIPKQKK